MRVFKKTGMDRNNKKFRCFFMYTFSGVSHRTLWNNICRKKERIDKISNSEYICLQEC